MVNLVARYYFDISSSRCGICQRVPSFEVIGKLCHPLAEWGSGLNSFQIGTFSPKKLITKYGSETTTARHKLLTMVVPSRFSPLLVTSFAVVCRYVVHPFFQVGYYVHYNNGGFSCRFLHSSSTNHLLASC